VTRSSPAWLGGRDQTGDNDPVMLRSVGRDYRADDAAVDAAVAAAARPTRVQYIGDATRLAKQLNAVLGRAYADSHAFPAHVSDRRLLLMLAIESVGAVLTGLGDLAQLEPAEQVADMADPVPLQRSGVLNTELEQR